MKRFETHIDENGIVVMTFKGSITKSAVEELKTWAEETKTIIQRQFEKTGKKIKTTVDLTQVTNEYDGDAITVLSSFVKGNQPYIEKTATFGANWAIKFAEDIIIALSGRTNIKAFPTKEDALKWLNS
mgnify:CR=1 FL=1